MKINKGDNYISKKGYKLKTEPHVCYVKTEEDIIDVIGLPGEIKGLDVAITFYESNANEKAFIVVDTHLGISMASFKVSDDVLAAVQTTREQVALMQSCIERLSENITKQDVKEIKDTQALNKAIPQPIKFNDYLVDLI